MSKTLEIDIEALIPVQHQPQSESRTVAVPEMALPDTVEINARHRIVLRCGKSSFTLYPNGKIVLRGEYILSEAEVCNRIAGGRVELN